MLAWGRQKLVPPCRHGCATHAHSEYFWELRGKPRCAILARVQAVSPSNLFYVDSIYIYVGCGGVSSEISNYLFLTLPYYLILYAYAYPFFIKPCLSNLTSEVGKSSKLHHGKTWRKLRVA